MYFCARKLYQCHLLSKKYGSINIIIFLKFLNYIFHVIHLCIVVIHYEHSKYLTVDDVL